MRVWGSINEDSVLPIPPGGFNFSVDGWMDGWSTWMWMPGCIPRLQGRTNSFLSFLSDYWVAVAFIINLCGVRSTIIPYAMQLIETVSCCCFSFFFFFQSGFIKYLNELISFSESFRVARNQIKWIPYSFELDVWQSDDLVRVYFSCCSKFLLQLYVILVFLSITVFAFITIFFSLTSDFTACKIFKSVACNTVVKWCFGDPRVSSSNSIFMLTNNLFPAAFFFFFLMWFLELLTRALTIFKIQLRAGQIFSDFRLVFFQAVIV
jgi:hypothetical protein